MIRIDVSGNKIDGVERILDRSKVDFSEIAYVGDNAFDAKVIKYILANGGSVYFITGVDRTFELKEFPDSENFIKIKKLDDILK